MTNNENGGLVHETAAANKRENNIANEATTMNTTRNGAKCPTDRLFMKVESFAAGAKDPVLENVAADLTDVAYRVALRHGVGDQWLELQLDLWGALTEALAQRSCSQPMK
jgi:hypothetical protein